MVASVILFIVYNLDEEEKIDIVGLKLTKDFKRSIPYIISFILLYLLCILISTLIVNQVDEFILPFKNINTWTGILILSITFFLSYPAYLGEEYGWRYFLQPALQERIGKRKGVLVLGVIWGIWHLPINIFYYSPETSLYSVLNQLIICIAYSVFFGYVYMKTKNIWTISLIHFFNNNLGVVLYGSTGANVVLTWKTIVINLTIFSIVYMPFLLAKEYRSQSKELENS